jgi:hypothetical protein
MRVHEPRHIDPPGSEQSTPAGANFSAQLAGALISTVSRNSEAARTARNRACIAVPS